jgi:hypothetical protein
MSRLRVILFPEKGAKSLPFPSAQRLFCYSPAKRRHYATDRFRAMPAQIMCSQCLTPQHIRWDTKNAARGRLPTKAKISAGKTIFSGNNRTAFVSYGVLKPAIGAG